MQPQDKHEMIEELHKLAAQVGMKFIPHPASNMDTHEQPRYTTRRLRHEVQTATESLQSEVAELNKQIQSHLRSYAKLESAVARAVNWRTTYNRPLIDRLQELVDKYEQQAQKAREDLVAYAVDMHRLHTQLDQCKDYRDKVVQSAVELMKDVVETYKDFKDGDGEPCPQIASLKRFISIYNAGDKSGRVS